MTRRVLALLAVGLTPKLLRHMPRLRALADDGFAAALDPQLPAVTCTMQSTFLTGLTPAGHGVVGNGWYFRDLGEVLFWRQHNALSAGTSCGTWRAGHRRGSGWPTCAGGTPWAQTST